MFKGIFVRIVRGGLRGISSKNILIRLSRRMCRRFKLL